MKTSLLAIVTVIAAVGAAGIVTAVETVSVAHASQFGSCNQLINGDAHLNSVKGKDAAADRKIVCTQFKP